MSTDRTHADTGAMIARLRERADWEEQYEGSLPDAVIDRDAAAMLDALVAERDAATERAEASKQAAEWNDSRALALLHRAEKAEAHLAVAREALTRMAEDGRGTQFGEIARAALAASGTPPPDTAADKALEWFDARLSPPEKEVSDEGEADPLQGAG